MKIKFFVIFIIFFSTPIMAREVLPGITFMAGGRYDDLRMCVASPAGIKGGPLADGMFSLKFFSLNSYDINLHIPVLRPILFGAAFKMLQFEPEFSFEFKKEMNSKIILVGGPGMGISFHYGPDYKSSKRNKGESFFAGGPIINGFLGIGILSKKKKTHYLLLKIFYTPLFAKNKFGNVAGGALMYSYYFL